MISLSQVLNLLFFNDIHETLRRIQPTMQRYPRQLLRFVEVNTTLFGSPEAVSADSASGDDVSFSNDTANDTTGNAPPTTAAGSALLAKNCTSVLLENGYVETGDTAGSSWQLATITGTGVIVEANANASGAGEQLFSGLNATLQATIANATIANATNQSTEWAVDLCLEWESLRANVTVYETLVL